MNTFPRPKRLKRPGKKERHLFIQTFENTLEQAELRALSNVSLEHELTDTQYERFKELMTKHYGYGEK